MGITFEYLKTRETPRRYCPICGKTMSSCSCRQYQFQYCEACDVYVLPGQMLESVLSDYAGKTVDTENKWRDDPNKRMFQMPVCRDNNVPMPSWVWGKEMTLFACKCPVCGDVCIGAKEMSQLAELVKNESNPDA